MRGHERQKRKRRGPYKKGKTPREKELEDVVKDLTTKCHSLERRLGSPSAWTSSTGINLEPQSLPDELDVDLRHGEITSHPAFTPNTAQTGPDGNTRQPLLYNLPGPQSAFGLLMYPAREQIYDLWLVHMTRVEPLTKLVPYSSFADVRLLSQPPEALRSDIQALVLSICMAAVNALSEVEVCQRLGETKTTVDPRLARAMQATLECPDTLQKPTTRLLQALVLRAVCYISC
jgi:hypothetical protein